MEHSSALVDSLTLLSDALDDPAANLGTMLAALNDDLTAAVPVFLGLTCTLLVEDDPVTLTTLNSASPVEVRSSLLLPLLPLREAVSTGSIAFYSGTPGAFIELADDARWIFDLAGPVMLDGHLPEPGGAHAGIRGLSALRDLNQAVGVLVEEGYSPVRAQTELRRRAIDAGQTTREAAQRLLSELPLAAGGH